MSTGEHGGKPEPILLTVEEAAHLLRVSRSEVYKLIRQGTLPAVRIGRATRLPRQALLDWIQRQLDA